jgi:outer membrane receptor protein involved in Fe transport
MSLRAFSALLLFCCLTHAALAATVDVSGRIVDPSGGALPGVTVTLTHIGGSELPAEVVTDAQGAYTFSVSPGRYMLHVELGGFASVDRQVVVDTAPARIDLQLALAHLEQEVTVTAEAPKPLMDDAHPDAPVTVSREVIDNAMLPNSQYDDVLPLMPNVVRGPDGNISVGGARAPQGALFVNGINKTDPVTGGAGYIIPIDAVDSMEVYSGGYPAELGRATGGVTSAITRSGADKFRMMADSALPRMLVEDGQVHGVEYWEPNIGASGHLARGHLFFQQALSYRFDRNPFTTVDDTDYRNIYRSLLSWSQVDAKLSDSQHLRISFGFDPQTTNHANITAFTPAPSMPKLDQGGWNASIAHDFAAPHGVLAAVHASVLQSESTVTPPGGDAYLQGHEVLDGSYFDQQARHGERLEAGGFASRAFGHHLVKIGVDVERNALDNTDEAAPATLLRSDGTPSQTISFLPAPAIHVSSVDAGTFAQDTWTPQRWLTIEPGVRWDHASGIGDAIMSPRVAWTIKPDAATTIAGSVGRFGDKVPLLALAFPWLPARSIQQYDATGAAVTPPEFMPNVVGGPLVTPRAMRWNLELDEHFGEFLLRTRYEERHGHDEFVVNAVPGAAVLTSRGTSSERSVEVTTGYQNHSGGSFYVSYVRAATQGNVNSLDAMEGIFRTLLVQPDQIGPLPADVPNRVLAWGVLHLFAGFNVAPYLEVRNGFAYQAINDDWLHVGAPGAFRLPWYGTLDLSINKIVDLPSRLPKARVGMKFYNLAEIHTEREVQQDILLPTFGTAYNPLPRDFAIVFEFLWGKQYHTLH